MEMGPNRPYLLRAFYEWLLDNECTPHLVVNATIPGVIVPVEHIKDGQIVLNIAPYSVGNFDLNNEQVSFSARFSGKPFQLVIPMAAIVAIYARENGEGTMFEDEEHYHLDNLPEPTITGLSSVESPKGLEGLEGTAQSSMPVVKTPKKDRGFLTVVK